MVFCKAQKLSEDDFQFFSVLPVEKDQKIFEARPLKIAIDEFKREYIERLLEQNGGNQTKVAKILKIQRTYLSRLLKELK